MAPTMFSVITLISTEIDARGTNKSILNFQDDYYCIYISTKYVSNATITNFWLQLMLDLVLLIT
jgi:hypothetical protein